MIDLNEMDFKGQHLADIIYQVIIWVATIAGFVHGYNVQSFSVTFYYWAAGATLAGVLTIPAWPCFRRMRVEWREGLPEIDTVEGAAAAAEESSNSSSTAEGAPAAVAAGVEDAAGKSGKGASSTGKR